MDASKDNQQGNDCEDDATRQRSDTEGTVECSTNRVRLHGVVCQTKSDGDEDGKENGHPTT